MDEPESHLHPSGVRFMLKELIKIADAGNIVLFATHSIFMIDREYYDRHIILEKKDEHTLIKPSSQDRIGFFMQEEVLYSTLDIDLNKDFNSTNRYNFVFEGDGDAVIFEHYYNNILSGDDIPFATKNTSFYHGGKCSDIIKYFSHRPIQLGTKWIFILDRDKPADDLKKFIEGKYKQYLNRDVFVYQYLNKSKKQDDIEFEDLLPINLMNEIYEETAKNQDFEFDVKKLKKVIKKNISFSSYNKQIMEDFLEGNNKDEFKEKLKEILNSTIKKKVEECKDSDMFKKEFPDYAIWANEIIENINHLIENG